MALHWAAGTTERTTTVTTEDPPVSYIVLGSVPKADDLEVVVRVADVDGVRVIDVRDFVPSMNFFGRGVTIPASSGIELAGLVSMASTR